MTASNVLAFSEKIGSMTFADGLAFIERTRRQLDRFNVAIPNAEAMPIASESEARVRRLLDEVEASIQASLAST